MTSETFTGFDGDRRIAAGSLADILPVMKAAIDRNGGEPILLFDDGTGRVRDIDWRETIELAPPGLDPGEPRRPGRPKLGVVAREVTLLPRHWEWLNAQPGGASVALRKLVEADLRSSGEADRLRRAREAAYRFMAAMAGDRPGFEDAARALFASDRAGFTERIAAWPPDIRDYAAGLAGPGFAGGQA